MPPFLPGASICISPMAVGHRLGACVRGDRAARSPGRRPPRDRVRAERPRLRPPRWRCGRPAALVPVRAAVETFRSARRPRRARARAEPPGLRRARPRRARPRSDTSAEALRLREEIGDRRGVTLTLANRGLAEAAAGDSDRGRESVAGGAGPRRGDRRPAGRGGHPPRPRASSSSSRARPGPPARWPRAPSTCSARRGIGAWMPWCSRSPASWPPTQGDRAAARGTPRRRSGCSPRCGHQPGRQRAAAVARREPLRRR